MKLHIAKEFSRTPGPRHISEGDHSGELFRTTVLLPWLRNAISKNEVLIVDLDKTSGFGTSFLEEAFGGLIRIDGYRLAELQKSIKLISEEEPEWLEEIANYMNDAHEDSSKD